ncbi:tetratricopeptide repeat protein [Neisseria sp. Ec49-e6-T10]|uniref:tetratricopeptide repeat protein n=1 Tax=Neisseria sp. Ec49-e6-T10 TaxID=3140744 RepID=UPI003EB9375A
MYRIFYLSLILLLSACAHIPTQTDTPPTIKTVEQQLQEIRLAQESFATKDAVNSLHDKVAQLTAENKLLQEQINELKSSKLIKKTTAPSSTANIPDTTNTQTNQSIYQTALKLYQNKQYLSAIDLLKPFAFGSDHSEEAQKAMYLLSLAHQKLRHCDAAIDISKRFTELFAQNSKAPEALYNMATCQTYLQQKDIAKETFKTLIKQYPNSNAAKRAEHKLK